VGIADGGRGLVVEGRCNVDYGVKVEGSLLIVDCLPLEDCLSSVNCDWSNVVKDMLLDVFRERYLAYGIWYMMEHKYTMWLGGKPSSDAVCM